MPITLAETPIGHQLGGNDSTRARQAVSTPKLLPEETKVILQKLKKQDRAITGVSSLCAGLLIFLFGPLQLKPAAAMGLSCSPLFILLALALPYALYHYLVLSRFFIKTECEKHYISEKRKLQVLRILFRSRYRRSDSQTFWEVKNANRFGWTHAKLLVEREHEGVRKCEKHHIGELGSGKSFTFFSNLEDKECAKWRIMVITAENRSLDFPDRWKEEPIDLMLQSELKALADSVAPAS
ncbi:MAG: hypothetical protein K0S07_1725 [Chlamydiales bacterium]|jgi:hypothetical protein|nr:hypothetical protein [Chlamydiales bacterium]